MGRKVDKDAGSIKIVRGRESFGRFHALDVFVDDVRIGSVRSRDAGLFPVEPGPHSIYVKMNSCRSESAVVEVAAARTSALLVTLPKSFLTLRAVLAPSRFFGLERRDDLPSSDPITMDWIDAFAYTVVCLVRAPGSLRDHMRLRWNFFRWNRRSKASHPGLVRLSNEKLKRLCPWCYERLGGLFGWLHLNVGRGAIPSYLVANHLWHGDSRAAVVVSVSPLLVAAYTDEMDCVAMLRFPDEFVAEYGLKVRDRLLTVNRYTAAGKPVADLEPGRLATPRGYPNFTPLIADFLTEDAARLAERKAEILDHEWTRAWVQGRDYLDKHGPRARDGRPFECDGPTAEGP